MPSINAIDREGLESLPSYPTNSDGNILVESFTAYCLTDSLYTLCSELLIGDAANVIGSKN